MSCAGLSITATQIPRSTSCWSTTLDPIKSCTHSASSSSSVSGSAISVELVNFSAAVRSATPSNRTSQRCCCRRDSATVSHWLPASSRAPGASRSTRSVSSDTYTWPLTPWARPMRPTSRRSSVDKVDVDLDAVAGGGGAHDRADALGGATAAADHPAEITRTDLDLELQAVAALDRVALHRIGIIDDRSHDVCQHRRGSRCGRLIRGLERLHGLSGLTGLVRRVALAGLIRNGLDALDGLVGPVGDGL